jgi:membrane fusion protein (multidrug efflux system)
MRASIARLATAGCARASPASGDQLAPGASVRVQVPVGDARRVVAVPVSALRRGPAGDHIFIAAADPNGALRAHVRPVQSGEVLGDQVVIDSGVKPGEQVATSGSFKLREGLLLVPASSPPAAPH